jgi:ferredoxin
LGSHDVKVDIGHRYRDPMRVTIDSQRCAASGACVRIAPDLFELPPGGKASLLEADPAEERRAALVLAAELCPTGAITVN